MPKRRSAVATAKSKQAKTSSAAAIPRRRKQQRREPVGETLQGAALALMHKFGEADIAKKVTRNLRELTLRSIALKRIETAEQALVLHGDGSERQIRLRAKYIREVMEIMKAHKTDACVQKSAVSLFHRLGKAESSDWRSLKIAFVQADGIVVLVNAAKTCPISLEYCEILQSLEEMYDPHWNENVANQLWESKWALGMVIDPEQEHFEVFEQISRTIRLMNSVINWMLHSSDEFNLRRVRILQCVVSPLVNLYRQRLERLGQENRVMQREEELEQARQNLEHAREYHRQVLILLDINNNLLEIFNKAINLQEITYSVAEQGVRAQLLRLQSETVFADLEAEIGEITSIQAAVQEMIDALSAGSA